MTNLKIIFFLFIISSFLYSQTSSFTIKNNSDIIRTDEVVEINLQKIIEKYPDFNFNSFSISDGNEIIPSELINDESTGEKKILFIVNLKPNESKTLTIASDKKETNKLTQAYLGIKTNYELKDGYYTGGYFSSVDSVTVPSDHFAHDALYQFEGPGWESEKVGYRLYLDDRNRTDIFGKKKPDLVVHEIGKNDLISDGKESYQSLQDWGMDVFKVGSSLGMGSISTYQDDSIFTVSKYDSVSCVIINNDLLSGVRTMHFGWQPLDTKYNLTTFYSIKAESRLTKVEAKSDKKIDNFSTGIPKHANTEFFTNENDKWAYIALWGTQTIINDDLGVAVIYNKKDLLKKSEDNLNYFVVLNPDDANSVSYYFAAAWEQDNDQIKTKEEFKKYLDEEITKLANPVEITIN